MVANSQEVKYFSAHFIQTNKGRNSDVATLAAFYLKQKVQQTWGLEFGGKENISHNIQDEDDFKRPIAPQDKDFLRFNIFKALDVAGTKQIQSAVQSIIFNIAECDFPDQWPNAVEEIG